MWCGGFAATPHPHTLQQLGWLSSYHFSTSNAWEMRHGAAEWRKSVKNGELVLDSANVKNKLLTFYDYVAEVTVRYKGGNDWSGFQFSNGADIECRHWINASGYAESVGN